MNIFGFPLQLVTCLTQVKAKKALQKMEAPFCLDLCQKGEKVSAMLHGKRNLEGHIPAARVGFTPFCDTPSVF